MAKTRIFISFDYDHDKHYKNLLVAWDKNKECDFSFYDQSVDVSVDSDDAAVIKRVISARIRNSTHLLCIVGKHTHKSGWVRWEIEKAVELRKKLVAVKTNRSNRTPTALFGVGTSWAMSFTFSAIKKAINEE